MKYALIILGVGLVSYGSSSNQEKNLVFGFYHGQKVHAELDSKIAAYYFQKQGDHTYTDSYLDSVINSTTSTLSLDRISKEDMALVSNNLSTDFATLFLIDELLKKESNRKAQQVYQSFDKETRVLEIDQQSEFLRKAGEYVFVFVPGLFYVRHPETGGDFAAQRSQLEALGLHTHLVKTKETGLVVENAKQVANDIVEISKSDMKIILVSASKGGPEVAYALGHVLGHSESKNVKAWISLGGVLRGSAVADRYLTGLNRWYAKSILFFIGEKISFVEDIGTTASLKRYDSLKFSKDLLTIHFVGAPLSSQVSPKVKDTYQKLSRFGPNDGLTTLVDELTPDGIVITELGLDHYYKHEHIDRKTISLLRTALELLDDQTLE